MEWATASIRLKTPTCPVVAQVDPGQSVQCLAPGGRQGPFAFVPGQLPAGWRELVPCTRGSLGAGPPDACLRCPLARLPGGVCPMNVKITSDGLTFDLLFPEGRALVDLLADFEQQGAGPVIVRVRSGDPPAAPPALVDLRALTPAQYRTLLAAHAIGYFTPGSGVGVDDLARMVGCSRSTVHEHLQKAVQALLSAVLSGPQEGAGLRSNKRNGRPATIRPCATMTR
jgi:hypothetical protein